MPFRTHTWNAWIADEEGFDPSDSMLAISEPSTLADVDAERLDRVKHLMVVHHDDPVNKFGYRQVVRPPWWMGRPDTRPPKVPREVPWRPISTFVLTLVDLKNGMHFAPGTFVRRGHDYRIDTVAATAAAFRLQPTEDQRQAVEVALRKREVEWARRRLIARKFAAAREAINTNLKKWGVSVTTLDSRQRATRSNGWSRAPPSPSRSTSSWPTTTRHRHPHRPSRLRPAARCSRSRTAGASGPTAAAPRRRRRGPASSADRSAA